MATQNTKNKFHIFNIVIWRTQMEKLPGAYYAIVFILLMFLILESFV